MALDNPLVVPFFYTASRENPKKSRAEGRPIFEDVDMIEYRIAGDRNFNPHFLAHEMDRRENGEEVTHAMRWPDEYRRFKETGGNQTSGTPLEELDFLTPARRSELKALKIYTVEALAALDGPNIKILAGEGYRFKEQAQAYLDASHGVSGNKEILDQLAALRADNAALRARLDTPAAITAELPTETFGDDPFLGMEDSDLKDRIETITGTRPRGNPSRANLISALTELTQGQAA